MTLSRNRPVTRLMSTASDTTPAERTTLSLWPLVAAPAGVRPATSLPVLFKEVGDRHDPGVVIRDFVFLIRRMEAIVWQSEPHQDGWNPQVGGEVSDNWNRSNAADEHGFLPEDIAEGLRGHMDGGMVRVHDDGRTGAQDPDFGFDAGRSLFLDEFLVGRDDFLRVLFGYQPDADLRRGARGDHGLGARGGESSGDAVHLKGGARPHTLQHAVAGFAGQPRRAHFVLQEFLLVKRQSGPAMFLGWIGRLDIIVDAWNLNDA